MTFSNEEFGLTRTVFAAGALLRCLFRGRKVGKVAGVHFVSQRAFDGSKQVLDLEPSSRVWGSMSDWPPWATVTSHRDEGLNAHWLLSVVNAKRIDEDLSQMLQRGHAT